MDAEQSRENIVGPPSFLAFLHSALIDLITLHYKPARRTFLEYFTELYKENGERIPLIEVPVNTEPSTASQVPRSVVQVPLRHAYEDHPNEPVTMVPAGDLFGYPMIEAMNKKNTEPMERRRHGRPKGRSIIATSTPEIAKQKEAARKR